MWILRTCVAAEGEESDTGSDDDEDSGDGEEEEEDSPGGEEADRREAEERRAWVRV